MKIKAYQEEFPTDLATIQRAEKLWGKQFPPQYKAFLLKHNGAIVYPCQPTIKAKDNGELWSIDRILSIGDVILQKQYTMVYTLKKEHYPEDLAVYQLNAEHLLTFAIGERGCYYINLSYQDFGRIYFCNYSGGDGIVRIETTSFAEFIDSLGMPSWAEEEYDPAFEFNQPYYYGNKIFQAEFFETEEQPELGLQRFKEVFARFGDLQPPEEGYLNLTRKYVYDRLKLDFLLEQGCQSEGLLLSARNAQIIKYLIEHLGYDINESYEGRYPLQNYLSVTSSDGVKNNYQLIDQLLAMKINLDWSLLDHTDEPLLKKLATLHEKYLEYEILDQQWWVKNGKPSGHQPFKRSRLIEEKLGIKRSGGWFSKLLGR